MPVVPLLTADERKILEALQDVSMSYEQLEQRTGITTGFTHLIRGLEQRGLVRQKRVGAKAWEITPDGEEALLA